jgi:hypothetical protein
VPEEVIVTRFILEKDQFDAEIKEATAGMATYDKGGKQAVATTEGLGVKLGTLSDKFKSIVPAAKDAGKAGTNLERLAASFDDVTNSTEGSLDVLKQLVAEASKTPQGQAALAGQLKESQAAALDALVAIKSISPEERKVAEDAQKILNAYDKFPNAIKDGTKEVTSLRGRLREAKEEAARIGEEVGKNTPAYRAAVKEAGRLKDEFDDLNKEVAAFNPDQKFTAVAGAIRGLAGGFAAAEGAAALFGVEEEGVGKALLKVQAALAISQGLGEFFGELPDALKTIRLLFFGAAEGATAQAVANTEAATAAEVSTAATASQALTQEELLAAQAAGLTTTESLAVVTAADAAASEADAVAKAGLAVATEGATAATGGLVAGLNAVKVAALENPFTAILVAAVALGVILYELSAGEKEAAVDYSKFVDELNKRTTATEDLSKLRTEMALLSQEAISISTNTSDTEAAIKQRNAIIADGYARDLATAQAAADAQEIEFKRVRDAFFNTAFDTKEASDKRKKDYDEATADASKLADNIAKIRGEAAKQEQQGQISILNFRKKETSEAVDNAKKRVDAEKAANELLAQLRDDELKSGLSARAAEIFDIDKKYDEQLAKAKDTFDKLRALTPVAQQGKVNADQGTAEEAIAKARNAAIEAANAKFRKEDEAAQKDFVDKMTGLALELKDTTLQLQTAQWDGLIAEAKNRGDEAVAQAVANGQSVAQAQAQSDAEISALQLQKAQSLLDAKLVFIDAEAEARKQTVTDANAELLKNDTLTADERTNVATTQAEQLAQIDADAAQKKKDVQDDVTAHVIAATKEESDAALKAAQDKLDALEATLGATADFFNNVSQLAKKNSAEQKALQLVAAVVNTYAGVAAVLGNPETIGPPPVDLAFRVISVAAILANGLGAVAKIASAFHGADRVGANGEEQVFSGPRDQYLYRLHKDERVVPAQVNMENWGMLEAMKGGKPKLDQYIALHYGDPGLQTFMQQTFIGQEQVSDPIATYITYMDSPDGQRASTSVMFPPNYDYNIVAEQRRTRRAIEDQTKAMHSLSGSQGNAPRKSSRYY